MLLTLKPRKSNKVRKPRKNLPWRGIAAVLTAIAAVLTALLPYLK